MMNFKITLNLKIIKIKAEIIDLEIIREFFLIFFYKIQKLNYSISFF